MLTHNRLYPHLPYEVINDVAQIIDKHLRNEWIIRIEYAEEVEYLNTSWQQWGKPFFKVKEPAEVIDNIFACHINNQHCSIRLHAEIFNPVSCLYYSICQARHVSRELRDALAGSVN